MPAEPEDLRRSLAHLIPDLRAFARFLARDTAVADDLVQEALLRALRNLAQFQPGTNLKAWTFTILRNVFYEQLRRHKVEARQATLAPPAQQSVPGGQEAYTAMRDLSRAIWSLSPLLREALTLVGAQGLSYEEAAAICDVPVGTMKARVSRARNAIARQTGLGASSDTDSRT